MSENKNMKLNDEMMENVVGGDGCDRLRSEPGTVIGPFEDYSHNKYIVQRDGGPEAIASYQHVSGLPLLEPGTRVMIALVGLDKWEIVGFI